MATFYHIARPTNPVWNLARTLVFVAIWSAVVVWGLPLGIVQVEHNANFDVPGFQELPVIGLALVIAGSLLVFWAAVTMALAGYGTPATFAAPRRLVVTGPYAWFRNPMVVGTLVQGVGLGALYGSLPVLLLFAGGALLWNLLRRRDDEDELQRVFGREFELYRRSVRCWLPMRKRWSPPPGTSPISYAELHRRRHHRR
ncbi:MAG TPA: methyltransferase [Gemmatimonadales bacterium]